MSHKNQDFYCINDLKKRKRIHNQERSDRLVLLCILLGFSISMIILVSTTHSAAREDMSRGRFVKQNQISVERAAQEIVPLLYAHGIDQLAQQVISFEPLINNAIPSLTEFILSSAQKSVLTGYERAEYLVALLYYLVQKKSVDQVHTYWNWILSDYVSEFKDNALLFVIAAGPYASLLPYLKQRHLINKQLITQGFRQAVTANRYDILQQFLALGLSVDSNEATSLLVQVAQTADEQMLASLLLAGANKEAVKNGKTVLILAVEANNIPMVKALLQAGVDPERSGSGLSNGLPLDIAFQKNHTEVESLLRKAIINRKRQ